MHAFWITLEIYMLVGMLGINSKLMYSINQNGN